MHIRKALMADLPRIMEIYAHARVFMTEHGNPRQWALRNWPPESLIRADIEAGKSHLAIEGERVVGVFFYDKGFGIEPTYAEIEGEWIGGDDYGVVHRIASDGTVKGTGRFCITWALEQCGNLRIDTHEDNRVMQNLLASLGFKHCGIIYVSEDKDPRLAYSCSRLPAECFFNTQL